MINTHIDPHETSNFEVNILDGNSSSFLTTYICITECLET